MTLKRGDCCRGIPWLIDGMASEMKCQSYCTPTVFKRTRVRSAEWTTSERRPAGVARDLWAQPAMPSLTCR